ncbi:MAG TPA: SDR family oxidoreductase [Chitinophagaceae bacterium]|nr:SDR family oxidoreductase [Chitinophagaceae bacterium]
MKILITGANGFLGYTLVQQLLRKEFTVIASGKGDCRLPFDEGKNFIYHPIDITDPFSVHDVFAQCKPEVVVHAAAISKPDDCELNQWDCYLVNTEGTIAVLLNAAEYKSHFIYLSTDFVFDGEKGMYKEDDLPAPVNFYGQTKLQAEEEVKEYEYDWAIVRTVLVYGKTFSGRGNIVTVVREKLEKAEEYKVFDDQFRTPTYVEDLAAGIVSIIEKKAKGIYHLSGTEMLTPYEMSCMTADHLGLNKSLIKKVTAAEFAQPAMRPPKTGFIIDKARKELGFEPLSFEEGLKKTFQ